MNMSNLLMLLAMQKMLQEPQVSEQTEQAKHEEYRSMAIEHTMGGGRESDLNPMLQYFVQNPTGSDTGPHQERQEMFQRQAASDPFLSIFQSALIS